MSRISTCFKELKQQGRTALIPFITAGDPQPQVSVPLMHALAQAGADIIELGVPFSDPMADGPVIQHASERALKHHVSLKQVLAMVAEFRSSNQRTPVVLMGYLNPVEAMGYASFAQAAQQVGVDGVLTVDLPPEEAGDLADKLRAAEIDPIFLVAPTSSSQRIKRIAAMASGFIYYVSVRGVTGASHMDIKEVADKLKAVRAVSDLPLGVGFGINSPEIAAQVAQVADAVVVGSALVKRIAELASQPQAINAEAGKFIASLRKSIDKVGAAA